MFFTHLGRIVAFLALAIGIWMIVGGVMIASEVIGPYEEALARYFPSKGSSGAVIDRVVYIIIFSIALGILTEIRSALRAKSTSSE